MRKYRYFIIYKPFGMVSRFGKEDGKSSLSDLKFDFPKDVYPVGRLDADSEGLLLLTNDAKLNHLLLNPKYGHRRTYLAQVEGNINNDALQKLREGIELRIDGKPFFTKRALAEKVRPENIPERNPPIRYRKTVPDSWIRLQISEGKNRQVRRMCAAAGFPVLRLIRTGIEKVILEELKPSLVQEIDGEELYKLLEIKNSQ